MCLTTKQKWPKIAWKPITTYKVVYSPNNHPSLLTLFQGFPIQIGCTYKESLINILRWRIKITGMHLMRKGIHSYKNESPARLLARLNICKNAIVVECTIPRFSLYWIGDNGDIVSNKLKYVKIL